MSDDKNRKLHLVKTEGLKATVYVCTSCIVVSLSTASVNFNTPPSRVNFKFDARLVSKTR